MSKPVPLSDKGRQLNGRGLTSALDAVASIRTEARRLRETSLRLERTAAALREQAIALEDRARELMGDRGPTDDALLRGYRIGDKAAELIGDGEAHYVAIHDALVDAGYAIAGGSPKDSLLAVLSRDERFESVRPRSGVYRRRERRTA